MKTTRTIRIPIRILDIVHSDLMEEGSQSNDALCSLATKLRDNGGCSELNRDECAIISDEIFRLAEAGVYGRDDDCDPDPTTGKHIEASMLALAARALKAVNSLDAQGAKKPATK